MDNNAFTEGIYELVRSACDTNEDVRFRTTSSVLLDVSMLHPEMKIGKGLVCFARHIRV